MNEGKTQDRIEEYMKKIEAVYNNLGSKDIDEAVEYYGKLFDIYEKEGNSEGIAEIFEKVSEIYSFRVGGENYIGSLYNRARSVCKRVNDKKSHIRLIISLLRFYSNQEIKGIEDELINELTDIINGADKYDEIRGGIFTYFRYKLGRNEFPDPDSEIDKLLERFPEMADFDSNAEINVAFGLVYDFKDEFDEAIKYYTRAERIYRKTGEYRKAVDVIVRASHLLRIKEEFQDAIASYLEALEIVRNDIGNSILEAEIDLVLSLTYTDYIGDLDKSILYASNSAKIFDDFKCDLGDAYAYRLIGSAYLDHADSNDDFKRVITYFENALKIYERGGRRDLMTKVLIDLGDAYKYVGDFKKSTEVYKRLERMLDYVEDEKSKAYILIGIGEMYMMLGIGEKAMRNFETAYKFYEKQNDYTMMSRCMSHIGTVSMTQFRDTKSALKYYEKALMLAEKGLDKNLIARLNFNIGFAYSVINDTERAMDFYEKAISLYNKLGKIDESAEVLMNIGELYLYSNPSKALKYLKEAYDIFESLHKYGNMGNLLFTIANAEFLIDKNKEKLIKTYNRAISLITEKGTVLDLIYALGLFGKVLSEIGENKMAIDTFKKRIDLAVKYGNKSAVEESKRYIEKIERNAISDDTDANHFP